VAEYDVDRSREEGEVEDAKSFQDQAERKLRTSTVIMISNSAQPSRPPPTLSASPRSTVAQDFFTSSYSIADSREILRSTSPTTNPRFGYYLFFSTLLSF